MSITWICVMSHVCPAGQPSSLHLVVQPASRPAILHVKNFNVGCYSQTVQPNFVLYLPCLWASLTSTIFYHFRRPWSWRGERGGGGGSQGQCKAIRIGFIFWHTFHLIRIKYDVVMDQVLSESYLNKGNNRRFTDYIKNQLKPTCIRTFMNQFESNLVWW